jgi:hypothetical protein
MTDDAEENLPVVGPASRALTVPGKAGGKSNAFLAKIRSGTAKGKAVLDLAPKVGSRRQLLAAALERASRPRLIFAIDATASREAAWAVARKVTDSLFDALPGKLDVALAVHGSGSLHTFTPFTSDASTLRNVADSVRCQAGQTALLEILDKARQTPQVAVVIYIGDVYEESLADGIRMADALRLRGTKLVVLHDATVADRSASADTFDQIARRTGGCVLPFDGEAAGKLRELLEALAVLAVGGIKMLAAKRDELPAATLLLEHLNGSG